jgi:hypothetical protein
MSTDTGPGTEVDWTAQLSEQLEWHWAGQLRPRLDGLTDEEYFAEPVPGCWNVRRRGSPGAVGEAGAGDWTIDFAVPEPDPPPVTTIAWRLGHVIVGVFGARVASHFVDPPGQWGPIDYHGFHYAGTAAEALAQLDAVHAAWAAGVRGLDAAALRRPVGPAEGDFADRPMAELVLHINREAIHHGAEIALLRDLHRAG